MKNICNYDKFKNLPIIMGAVLSLIVIWTVIIYLHDNKIRTEKREIENYAALRNLNYAALNNVAAVAQASPMFKICPKCNWHGRPLVNPVGDKFCPMCGYTFPKPAMPVVGGF